MEAKVDLVDDTVKDFVNTSVVMILTNGTKGGFMSGNDSSEDEVDIEILYWLDWWVGGVLTCVTAILGVVANIVSIIVLSSRSMKSVFNHLLLLLCVADLMFLVTNLMTCPLALFPRHPITQGLMQLLIIADCLCRIFLACSVFFTVSLTIERYQTMSVMLCLVLVLTATPYGQANPHAKKLYDDLLHNYNRLIRPVSNFTETLTVRLGLKLSQLIGVDLKNQVMTTNVWVDQNWQDYKLQWNPKDYGGVEIMYVPSERIWLPDIVLYNNADGKYEVTLMTKATLKYNGDVSWTPPAIYKSSCEINVEWFPFDEQSCDMKFASWTYDGNQVDLDHMHQEKGNNVVAMGIDLTEFYLSVEWDILETPATKNVEHSPLDDDDDVDAEYPEKLLTDITFIITMRRKTLFYTVNLIIPCVGISFLTVLVFYLPSDSGEKVTLCISILLSLTVFFLLLAEIIPPTSLAVPLLGKYLLFTMIMITLSILVTVGVLNIHFRSPATHKMSPWLSKMFLHVLPRVLMMRRPQYSPRYSTSTQLEEEEDTHSYIDNNTKATQAGYRPPYNGMDSPTFATSPKFSAETITCDDTYGKIMENGAAKFGGCGEDDMSLAGSTQQYSPELLIAMRGVQLIAQHIKKNDKDNEEIEDWKYVAMVLDRLFLWLFTFTCIMGTGIILRAPSLYDRREPIDAKYTTITTFTSNP